jgi:hypothetical protein
MKKLGRFMGWCSAKGTRALTLGALAMVFSVTDARADLDSGLGFDLGFNLGIASYRASVQQTGYAEEALGHAQIAADQLSKRGLVARTSVLGRVRAHADLHAGLVRVRQEYEIEIRGRSNGAANAYRLGLLLGLAEAQCLSPVWGKPDGAWKFAHDALEQVETLLAQSGLSELKFDRSLLSAALDNTNSYQRSPGDAYLKVKALRESYRDVVMTSAATRSRKLR